MVDPWIRFFETDQSGRFSVPVWNIQWQFIATSDSFVAHSCGLNSPFQHLIESSAGSLEVWDLRVAGDYGITRVDVGIKLVFLQTLKPLLMGFDHENLGCALRDRPRCGQQLWDTHSGTHLGKLKEVNQKSIEQR